MDYPLNQKISGILNQLRQTSMKPGEIAFKLGVSYRTVLRWIKGEALPHRSSLRKLDELFNIKGEKQLIADVVCQLMRLPKEIRQKIIRAVDAYDAD